MNARFIRNLQIVTSIHVAILVALFWLPFVKRLLFWEKEATIIPVDFTVVVPDQGPSASVSPGNKDISSIILQHKHEMAAIARKEKKLEEQRAKEKQEREDAAKKEAQAHKLQGAYLGRPSKNATDKPLSEAEIRRLLAMGARPGEKNSIPPDEESMCFALLKRAFNDAWAQPSYDEVGGAIATIEVRLQRDGSIFGVRMVKPSGNNVLDASVMKAATGIKHVDGLTPAFLGKYEEVNIDFKVQPQ